MRICAAPRALGGYLPRRKQCEAAGAALARLRAIRAAGRGKEMSTTMACAHADAAERRHAGPASCPSWPTRRAPWLANLFKQVGIYSSRPALRAKTSAGARYRGLTARFSKKASAKPARLRADSCSDGCVHGLAMLPFCYYSMFGFQRVGDAIGRRPTSARGFLLGATSGRTTLGGEGLQHQDGSSHLVAATIPNCKAYDPAYAGEMAVIIDAGMREMVTEQRDVFYYVTLMNENYAQPDLPAGAAEGVLRGCYVFKSYSRLIDKRESTISSKSVTLMGFGAI